MNANLLCYRCGASLDSLTPPISRQDMCPSCSVYLHVCRMCVHFDPAVTAQCREDDAEEVTDKEKLNFCEWYQPSAAAFDAAGKQKADAARTQLGALFGADSDAAGDGDDVDDASKAAEDLFK